MPAIDLTFHVDAPREVVFDVMTDHAAYSDWGPVHKAKLEKEGDPAPNGRGAVRMLKAVPLGPKIREEIIGYDAPATMSYKLLSGLPLKDHIGTITLIAANEGGTELRYHVETRPSLPVAKFVLMAIIRKAVKDLAKAIKGEAEKRAAAPAS
jgi:uncharacterized protein YndB with AHSA1/START domain